LEALGERQSFDGTLDLLNRTHPLTLSGGRKFFNPRAGIVHAKDAKPRRGSGRRRGTQRNTEEINLGHGGVRRRSPAKSGSGSNRGVVVEERRCGRQWRC
jgi:hypothetical protein